MYPATRSRSASSPEPRRLVALIVAALLVAGCGDDTARPPASPDTEPPTTTVAPSTSATPGATAPTSTTAEPISTTTNPTTTSPATSAAVAPDLPTGLVWTGDFPDPFVVVDGDGYHAYSTSSGFVEVQRLETDARGDWTGPREALGERAEWAAVLSIWAPAVLRVDDHYLMYYTARVEGTDLRCISVARAAGPGGPFIDVTAEPWLCPTELGGAIDLSLIHISEPTRLLVQSRMPSSA